MTRWFTETHPLKTAAAALCALLAWWCRPHAEAVTVNAAWISLAIEGGLALANALAGSKASKNAANTQAASADKALDLNRSIWQTQQANFAPYLGAGQGALQKLSGLMGIPYTSPGILPGQTVTSAQIPSQSVRPSANAQYTGQVAMPRDGGVMAGQTLLQAPNGSVKWVSNDQVNGYLAAGARRVN